MAQRRRVFKPLNYSPEKEWRSLKYEAVYLHELGDGFMADRVIGEWIGFYNTSGPIPPSAAGRRRKLMATTGPWI